MKTTVLYGRRAHSAPVKVFGLSAISHHLASCGYYFWPSLLNVLSPLNDARQKDPNVFCCTTEVPYNAGAYCRTTAVQWKKALERQISPFSSCTAAVQNFQSLKIFSICNFFLLSLTQRQTQSIISHRLWKLSFWYSCKEERTAAVQLAYGLLSACRCIVLERSSSHVM